MLPYNVQADSEITITESVGDGFTAVVSERIAKYSQNSANSSDSE